MVSFQRWMSSFEICVAKPLNFFESEIRHFGSKNRIFRIFDLNRRIEIRSFKSLTLIEVRNSVRSRKLGSRIGSTVSDCCRFWKSSVTYQLESPLFGVRKTDIKARKYLLRNLRHTSIVNWYECKLIDGFGFKGTKMVQKKEKSLRAVSVNCKQISNRVTGASQSALPSEYHPSLCFDFLHW